MAHPSGLTGVLLIDKPSGPTSHDVVARLRRVLNERRIGHTGTLDPLASGLLPLVVGPATRLAALLSGHDKTYDATIRLGVATTTDDALGDPIDGERGLPPPDAEVRRALDAFHGTFEQRPPAHSAKKLGGVKAYQLARRAEPVDVRPVPVTVRSITWLARVDGDVRVRVTATAGFYVRALARDLGARLGCGGHLTALRRVRSGAFDVADALPLAAAEESPLEARARLIAPADALPELPGVALSEDGLRRVRHGHWVESPESARFQADLVKILAPDGQLVALARVRAGALHPVAVLG